MCLFLSQLLLVSLPLSALPKYERTMLPFPDRMDEGDQLMAQEVLQLQVYQDHEDENQYYFVPPFHVRQYTQGAAGMALQNHNVKQFAAANKEIKNRVRYLLEYDNGQIQSFEKSVAETRSRVEIALQKLEDAIERGNEVIIKIRERNLASEEDNLKKAIKDLDEAKERLHAQGTLAPLSIRKGLNEQIVMELAQAGINVPYDGNQDPGVSFIQLKDTIKDFASSYGGYLSANVYGGFTQGQVDALRAYKQKYMPHLKISLLPIEKLTFFSLTEWQNDPNAWSYSSKMFRNITGAGDYLGAAIVMDTTIAGSLGLAEHLQPFVLPVGIKARFKQAAEPTEAELTCDFSAGYSVQGRADVRDGLVIYDNDITNTISSSDFSNGACKLHYISGDRGSAQFKALEAMEQQFENIRIHRTILAHEEKTAYYKSLLEDIQKNRRQEEPKYRRIVRQLTAQGWSTVVVEGLTRAADFHWHTNIQDVNHVSEVKFTKHIYIAGSEMVERDLPTNFCLVFNSMTNAYDKCTTDEEKQALDMQRASRAVAQTPECANTVDPFECGKNRDQAGLTRREGPRVPVNDTVLVNALH